MPIDSSDETGGFDAKNDEQKGPKDAAGKAIGYEDDEAKKRENLVLQKRNERRIR